MHGHSTKPRSAAEPQHAPSSPPLTPAVCAAQRSAKRPRQSTNQLKIKTLRHRDNNAASPFDQEFLISHQALLEPGPLPLLYPTTCEGRKRAHSSSQTDARTEARVRNRGQTWRAETGGREGAPSRQASRDRACTAEQGQLFFGCQLIAHEFHLTSMAWFVSRSQSCLQRGKSNQSIDQSVAF